MLAPLMIDFSSYARKCIIKTALILGDSKRAFQTQFRRWNFPTKQRPAHKNERLVTRVRELWEKNFSQREMQAALDKEGFEIKPRELMRVRMRNRWLLRVARGEMPTAGDQDDELASLEDGSASVGGDSNQLVIDERDAASQPTQASVSGSSPQHDTSSQRSHDPAPVPSLEPREERAEQPRKKLRKRGRHSPDSPRSSTRFPSEMTIDAARLILGLDANSYREVRTTFQGICQADSITKKTIAGPERWEGVKARLIREVTPLQATMWLAEDNMDSKNLALDVICTDVTKRLRTIEARMTLAEAKNALGVNPEESRDVRAALHQVLRDTGLTCKSEATPEQWEAVKRRWGAQSQPVQKILDGDDTESDLQFKLHALEYLAKDIMKRIRDERARDERARKYTRRNQPLASSPPAAAGGGRSTYTVRPNQADSSPSPKSMDVGDSMADGNFDAMSDTSHASQMAFESQNGHLASHLPMSLRSQGSSIPDAPGNLRQPPRVLGSSMTSGMPMDSQMGSSLLLAASAQAAFMEQPYVQQQFAVASPPAPVFHPVQPVPTVYAVYLRLHPSSTFVTPTSLWIATMTTQSLQELRQAAVDKFPGALCIRVEGILRDAKGVECPLQIEQDQQLGAYLVHLQGGTPTFNVQLVWKS